MVGQNVVNMGKRSGGQIADDMKDSSYLKEVHKLIEENKKTKKEAVLNIKGVKANTMLLEKVVLFEDENAVILKNGQKTSNNEPVFKVLIKGEDTDDFPIKVNVGDLVMLSNSIIFPHLGVTELHINGGEQIHEYYVANRNDVALVVDYYKK